MYRPNNNPPSFEDLPDWHEESPNYIAPPACTSSTEERDLYEGRRLDEFRGLTGEERFSTYGNWWE